MKEQITYRAVFDSRLTVMSHVYILWQGHNFIEQSYQLQSLISKAKRKGGYITTARGEEVLSWRR